MHSIFPLRVGRNQFRTFLGTIPSFLSLAVTKKENFYCFSFSYKVKGSAKEKRSIIEKESIIKKGPAIKEGSTISKRSAKKGPAKKGKIRHIK